MMAASSLKNRARQVVRPQSHFQSVVAVSRRALDNLCAWKDENLPGISDARAMLAASTVVQRAREVVLRQPQPPTQLALTAYEQGRYLDALRAWKEASQLRDPEA